ncbi:Pentatricopeptide repeat-containing protein [Quillaja saponaria]|uniref:Pentatricopeptide repeat-containing protein n=1 Tax=Quillaja saponaria TaxID=32244 RepID=A0AAD7PTQ4_QUISA|nr:Pentatricopeptide repeat-containing protein [Quillaja saponaria]
MPGTVTYKHNYILNSTTPENVSRKRVKELGLNKNPDLRIEPTIPKLRHGYRSPLKSSKGLNDPPNFLLTRALIESVDSGSMEDALVLFEKTNHFDAYVWNIMIRGYTNNGLFQEAIRFYHRMEYEEVQTDNFTYPFVIKACGGLLAMTVGEKVHGKLFKIGLDSDVYICNALISMYGKLGNIEYALKVFDEMHVRDLVSWNSLISAYSSVGDGSNSLMCFREMLVLGIQPDRFSIVNSLVACSLECCLHSGKEIHCVVLRHAIESDVMVQTSLVDMYGKCGRVDYAERLFNRISPRNIVAWNAMIGGYALNGSPPEAFGSLRKMREADNLSADSITLVNLLPSCAQLGAVLQGKAIHGYAIRKGFLPHPVLETALLDLHGEFEALKLFQDLLTEHLKPDGVTIASILPAYASLASLREGRQIHGYITKSERYLNTFILNSLVYMYASCGDIGTARKIFDLMSIRDIISWNTILMAYAIHGLGRSSIELFSEMRRQGIKPNESTFVSLLSSCSISGMVNEGWKHYSSMRMDYGIEPRIEHYGCMLDLIGRTGNLDQAKSFIEEMPLVPTARIWGSLLNASRMHRNLELAELAAEHILSMEHDNTGCQVLLSNMYAEAGRWDNVEDIKSAMKKEGSERPISCQHG